MTKVLLVEDEPLIRMGLAVSCEEAGFVVLEATDGIEALELLRSDGHIKVVVTDIDMPRMDGLELSRIVRVEFPNVQVVLVSGMTFSRMDDFPVGVPFFEKPINDLALVECLRGLAEGGG